MSNLSGYGATNHKVITAAQTHPDYAHSACQIMTARDCLEGEDAVKRKQYTYLSHPSQVETTSDEQVARYNEFLEGAEFDEYPAETSRSLLGKLKIDNASAELPERVEYLIDDTDGDGMTITGAMEYAASNALVTKWHLLVVDYAGLGDVALEDLSIADAEKLNPRAKIKQYTRENVVNWQFERINGVMQLSFLMLMERGTVLNKSTLARDCIESYLVLALDDNGDYYQQKVVYGKEGKQEGELEYVTVAGQRLKWLPVSFVSDEQLPPNELPKQMGFIYPVCLRALSKYRVSAVYKEVQRNMSPTTFTSGWKDGDAKIFSDANGGRTYISTGAGSPVNNLPEGVVVDYKSAASEMSDFQWYFEQADKKIKQMAGIGNTDNAAMTATEADIKANNLNAMLETLANNIEQAFEKAITYCMMFEGMVSPDSLESVNEQISISLPRDFASPKLTVEEVRVLIELRMNSHISKQEFMRKIEAGGWLISDVETIIDELETEGPDLALTANQPQPQPLVSDQDQP